MFAVKIPNTNLRQSSSAILCPYCKGDVSTEPDVRCDGCGTLHHESCWNQYGHCTVFGCKGQMEYLGGSPLRRFVFLIPALIAYGYFFGKVGFFVPLMLPAFLLSLVAVIHLSRDLLNKQLSSRNVGTAEMITSISLIVMNWLAFVLIFKRL